MLSQRSSPLPVAGIDGEVTDLREMAAPVTVVSMWATFCEPCIEELPELEALHQRYADDPEVRIVTVSVDPLESRERVAQMLAERAPTVPAYFDSQGAVAQWLSPPGSDGRSELQLPLLAVVDREARVHVRLGYEVEATEGPDAKGLPRVAEVIEAARRDQMPPSPPPAPTQAMPPGAAAMLKLTEPTTPDEIPAILEQVETILRASGDASDEQVEATLDHVRAQLEAGRTEIMLGNPGEANSSEAQTP